MTNVLGGPHKTCFIEVFADLRKLLNWSLDLESTFAPLKILLSILRLLLKNFLGTGFYCPSFFFTSSELQIGYISKENTWYWTCQGLVVSTQHPSVQLFKLFFFGARAVALN